MTESILENKIFKKKKANFKHWDRHLKMNQINHLRMYGLLSICIIFSLWVWAGPVTCSLTTHYNKGDGMPFSWLGYMIQQRLWDDAILEFPLWHNGISGVLAILGQRFDSWPSRVCCCSFGLGCNYGSDLIPGLRTPYAAGGQKRKILKRSCHLSQLS